MSICAKLSALAALCLLFASCAVPEKGAPGGAVAGTKFHRISGSMTARLGCSMFDADKAVVAAAKKMQLLPLSRRNQLQKVTYEYKNIYEDRVDIELQEGKKGLNLYIKMGKGGDRAFSRKLLREIADRIPEGAVVDDEAEDEEESEDEEDED